MATCAKCGATLTDETALFCGICGARLPRAEALAPASVTPRPASARPVVLLSDTTVPDAPHFGDAAPPPAPPDADAPAGEGRDAPIAAAAAGAPDHAPKAAKHLPAGALVDKKYAVLRVLGEGGMGVVYLCRDIHTGLDVVVKAVRSELSHRDDVRARTLAEGRALAQIDHPNVVQLRAVAVEGPHLYLVMQYIEGESLDRVIARHAERGERLPIEEALGLFRQIVAGVGAAHEEGVIHRDLKPANVIVRKKDRVAKVTDFGIALVVGEPARPSTRGILGSLWYMSPEQVTGRPDLDRRVDVYALGILLYQMLVGRVPFDAKSDYEIMRQQAEAPMPRVAASRGDVPAAVDELLQRACAKDREARFQRCDELGGAVDRILASFGAQPVATLAAVTAPGTDVGALIAQAAAPKPPSPGVPRTAIEPPVVLPPEVLPTRRVWPWFVLAAVVAAAGAGGAVAAGLVPGRKGGGKPARPPPSASTTARPSAPGSATVASAPRGLAALAGPWVSNGRELDAVLVGADLEFRVRRPEQFPRQGYEPGEARFVLRAAGDAYLVEDRIRPVLPIGKTYDARARGTCQEVWSSASGDPLRARFDGARLSVEFAKIEPGPGNFTTEGARVTSCVGLRDLRASKVVSVLARP